MSAITHSSDMDRQRFTKRSQRNGKTIQDFMKKWIAEFPSMTRLLLRAASFVFVSACVTASASTNTPPTIQAIADRTAYVDHPVLIQLFVGDAESPPEDLQISLHTDNPTLVDPETLLVHYYTGDHGNWYVTMVPTFGLTGTATNTVTVSDGTNSVSTSFMLTVIPPPPRAARFVNSSSFTIPDSGPASLYPSTIAVTGMSGTVTNLDITISKFAHHFPDDVHMLLVGPTGQSVVFWSKCGGDKPLTNDTVTVSDAGVGAIPDNFEIWSEQMKPADYAANDPPANNTNDFPAPAPGAPYTNAVAMSSFNGLPANGTWSLYVYDDYPPDHGMIAGGWSLMVTTTGGRELAVSGITAADKVYDGTNSATINTNGATLIGVVNGDDVTLVSTGASGTFADKNAGTNKTVTINGLALGGTNAENYSLASPAASTTANITPATLTVKADDQTRVYGATNPVFTASYSGFTNGENLGTSGVTGSPSLTTSATPTDPVSGSPYTITAAIGSLTASNYTFSFLNGSLTITPADTSVAVISSINPHCSGAAVNFTATVTPSGAGTPTGTVQFTVDGGDFGSPVPLSGNSATSGNIFTLTAGGHTITAVYGGDGNFNGTTSLVYTQTVTALPASPTAGNNDPICLGATLHLTASPVTNATYSWTGPNGFISTDQNPTISNVTANTAGLYSVTATANGCVSAAGTTTVVVSSAPSISDHSPGATKCVGDTITFSVTARGNDLTYQWRKDGTTITNATGSSYLISSISAGDAGSYDCVVSGACSPPATSGTAVLTVSPPSVGGAAAATVTSVYTGDATTITLSGFTGTIQWQSSTDNVVFASMSGETNATVNTGPLVVTTYFQAVVTSSPCTAATSTVASVSVSTAAVQITSITLQNVDVLIAWITARGHTNFVQAVNGNPNYSTNFVDISGSIIIPGSGFTSSNYVDVGGATNTPARFYRVRLVP